MMNKLNLKDNIFLESYDDKELMNERISFINCCGDCKSFNNQITTMGICENKEGCLCGRMVDMFDERCESHSCSEILYSGELIQISDGLAEECVNKIFEGTDMEMYYDYYNNGYTLTPKESILSTSPLKYCIIYKEKI
jgi:hypothetical protein